MTTAMRKHVSNFTCRLGPIASTGYLVGVRMSKAKDPEAAPKTHYVTPDGKPVQQRYVDAEGNQYEQKQLSRGTIGEDKSVKVVDTEALAEAKKSELAPNVLDLTVHPAEARDQMFPDEANGYVWVPNADEKKNVDFYDTILAVVRHSDKVLLGLCNLKGHEGLYTLTEWRGYIVIQKVLYPASLNAHEVRQSALPGAARRAVLSIVDSMVQDYDPEVYRNQITARSAEVVEAAVEPGGTPKKVIVKKPKVEQEHDLLATLLAMDELVKADA